MARFTGETGDIDSVMKQMICAIYRSTKKQETYLYIDKKQGLDCLPEALLEVFGQPQEAFTMLLREDKKLASVDASKVLASLEEKGYYLQLPPAKNDYMQKINLHNHKMNL